MISGLYLHIPFCERRCHYCDFNTYEGMFDIRTRYVDALAAEIGLAGGEGPLKALYFGGGTPSLLSPESIAHLIDTARARFGILAGAEITLEANPGTADQKNFEGYLKAGVNRLSFGFQAKQDRHLLSLGRIHTSAQSEEAWDLARKAGFRNLSLDLMFGLPDQTEAEWHESLEWGLGFQPEHLSFYGLTIEPGTRFGHLHAEGKLPLPGEDPQADMYEWGIRRLAEAGLKQYEISNFARPGFEAVHNQFYWLNEPTLGLGAGAWSFDGKARTRREKAPLIYIEAIEQGRLPLAEVEELAPRQALGEAAWLGLRRLEGIDLNLWKSSKGTDFLDDFGAEAKPLLDQGLLFLENGHLRLSSKALPLANEVFSAFV